jgi:hypothetical protein
MKIVHHLSLFHNLLIENGEMIGGTKPRNIDHKGKILVGDITIVGHTVACDIGCGNRKSDGRR